MGERHESLKNHWVGLIVVMLVIYAFARFTDSSAAGTPLYLVVATARTMMTPLAEIPRCCSSKFPTGGVSG